MVEMGRKRRLKRVSWAPGVSLCQVRLFLSEDAPCQSGLSAQDHLQAKDSWIMHASAEPTSDDSSLPPGFESVHNQNHPKTDISKIPLLRWKCPPKIVLNPEWYVVSGEESQEIAKQNQRNLGVLEAIYPRQSTIPPNPSISPEAQNSYCDNSSARLVPLTAVEEDDPSGPSDSQPAQSEPSPIQSEQPNSVWHHPPPAQQPPALSDMSVLLSRLGAHADVAAATAAAMTALTRSTEQGNLIDQELLIKILSDPSLMEKLLPEKKQNPNSSMVMSASLPPPPPRHTAYLFNSVNNPNPNPNPNPRPTQPMVPTTTLSGPVGPVPLPPPPTRPNIPTSFSNVRPTTMVGTVAAPPPPQTIARTSRPLPSVTAARDVSYYKSLIQQHGGENPVSTKPGGVNGTGAGTTVPLKPKIQKTCAYFNTPKGCRHGDGCMFLHESSVGSRDEERSRKRVKFDNNGIVGRI